MVFFLGVLGVLQITLLPGLIAHRVLRIQGNFIHGVLMVFGLSLFVNYCAVFFLAILGIYTRGVLVVLMLAESVSLLWLYREDLRTPVQRILEIIWDELIKILAAVFPGRQNGSVTILYYFIVAFFALLSIKDIAWIFNVFLKNLGSVFSAWDAVVSWNRWAVVWFTGEIPMDSHLYPQLIPLNWSIPYVLMGDTAIQFFAKGIMPLFALFLLAAFFNLVVETARYYFFISTVVMGILLRDFLNAGITNGYVDLAVAFFTFLAVYMLIRARAAVELEQRDRLLLIGALFSAGAAVTKQTGVYIALCYPVLALVVMGLFEKPFEKERLTRFFYRLAIISVVWVSWYVYKEVQILLGVDRPNLDVLIELSADKYEGAGVFQQILAAIGQFEQLVFLLVVTVVAFPFMDRFYKTLTILIAPYPILWAWMAGYDTRNLAIFLPILALLSGYAIHKLGIKAFGFTEKIKLPRMPIYLPIFLAVAGLVYLNMLASPAKLLERQETLQKEIFSPAKNEMLYDLIAREGAEVRILTNYPMEYLPGLEQYQVRFNFQDYDMFLAHVEDSRIAYLFFSNAIDDSVKQYINEKMDNGDYELVLKDTQWKAYTLVRIVER
jgi:hypothetical protein